MLLNDKFTGIAVPGLRLGVLCAILRATYVALLRFAESPFTWHLALSGRFCRHRLLAITGYKRSRQIVT